MELNIISPTSKEEIKVTWLEINTPTGNLVIQTGHAPSIFTLTPAKEIIFQLPNGKKETRLIQDGLVHVTRETITLIINK